MAGEICERRVEREDPFAAVRELLRLARRCVSPFEDGEESSYTQAEALHEALTMEPGERRRRAEAIQAHVRANDVTKWVQGLLADLDRVSA